MQLRYCYYIYIYTHITNTYNVPIYIYPTPRRSITHNCTLFFIFFLSNPIIINKLYFISRAMCTVVVVGRTHPPRRFSFVSSRGESGDGPADNARRRAHTKCFTRRVRYVSCGRLYMDVCMYMCGRGVRRPWGHWGGGTKPYVCTCIYIY